MSKISSGAVKAAPPLSSAQKASPAFVQRHGLWLAILGLSVIVMTLYLPSLGFQFILDDHRFTADPRIQNSGHLAVAGIIVLAFTPLTLSQQKQWRDDLAVFTAAHELAPHNAPVARNLADARVRDALLLEEEGRCNEATPVFLQVSREYPDDWYPLAGLGYCYAQSNDFVRAEDFLHRAADLSHDSGIIQQWQELRAQMGLPSLQPNSK